MEQYQIKLQRKLLDLHELLNKLKNKNKNGQYGDFSSDSATPKVDLCFDLGRLESEISELVQLVMSGEFDG